MSSILIPQSMVYKDKADVSAANKRQYEKNKGWYRERNQRIKQELTDRLRAFKDVPCMDCGVRYPYYVMDLDHRPGEVKLYEPARLVSNGSRVKFEQEIAKCDVVCSNCHRQRTFDRKTGE